MSESLVDARSSVLLGAATGMRSQMGMTVVLVGAERDRLPGYFRRSSVVRSSVVALAGELFADKTAKVMDRLRPGPLVARFGLGAASAALLAHSRGRPVLLPAAIAGASALVAAKVAHDVRGAMARQVPDYMVAVAEDLVSLGCAAVAVRSTGAGPVGEPVTPG